MYYPTYVKQAGYTVLEICVNVTNIIFRGWIRVLFMLIVILL